MIWFCVEAVDGVDERFALDLVDSDAVAVDVDAFVVVVAVGTQIVDMLIPLLADKVEGLNKRFGGDLTSEPTISTASSQNLKQSRREICTSEATFLKSCA